MVKTKAKSKTNKNYKIITDRLISLLERGVKPWIRPWKTNGFGNLIGGNKYRGCNPLICQMDMMYFNYSSPYFVSFNQAREKGWKIKSGSKATTLTYAESFEVETDVGTETRFHTRFYKVFNTDCIDDTESEMKIADLIEEKVTPSNQDLPIESLEKFCNSWGVDIEHGGDRACYSPSLDRIAMPEFENFSSARAYYSTLLHELAHSTGHPERLNRDMTGSFGTTKYAREELVAELTSAFVASNLGINEDLELENHASYLASWLKVLKNDDKAFFNALSQAKAASDYLLQKNS